MIKKKIFRFTGDSRRKPTTSLEHHLLDMSHFLFVCFMLVTSLTFALSISAISKNDCQLLFDLLNQDSPQQVKEFLKGKPRNLDLTGCLRNNCNPFLFSVEKSTPEIIELIRNYTDKRTHQSTTSYRHNSLFVAAKRGSLNVLDILLETKVDRNLVASDTTTALFIACQNGHEEFVKRFSKKVTKTTLNYQSEVPEDEDSYTPLMLAVKNNLSSITQLLLDNKADIFVQSGKKGKSALELAILSSTNECQSALDQLLAHLKKNNDNPLYDEFIWTAIEIANREDKDHLKAVLFSMLDLEKQSIRFANSASTEEFSWFNLSFSTLRDSLVEIAYSFAAQWDNSVIPLSVVAPTPFTSTESDYSSNTLSRRGEEDNRSTRPPRASILPPNYEDSVRNYLPNNENNTERNFLNNENAIEINPPTYENAIRNGSSNKKNPVRNRLPPPSIRFNFNTNQ